MQLSEANAAMGIRAAGLSLINCGHRTYRVKGYPLIRLLDEDGDTVDARVLTEVGGIVGALKHLDVPPQPVVLQPGDTATSVVVWRNKYDDIRNPPVEVASLDVAPQQGLPRQEVQPPGPLDLGNTGRIGVSPWAPRTTTPASPDPSPAVETPEPPLPLL